MVLNGNSLTTSARGNLKIISCRSSEGLAQKIVDAINTEYTTEYGKQHQPLTLGSTEVVDFADGDSLTKVLEHARGADVYVVQEGCGDLSGRSFHDNFAEFLLMLSTVKKSCKASNVVAVNPCFFSARQDRTKQRESYNAQRAAIALESTGINGLITMDLHSPQVTGYFREPWVENLYASNELFSAVETKYGAEINEWAWGSGDASGFDMALHYAKRVGISNVAMALKARDDDGKIMFQKTLGDVDGKTVCIVDDMIDTAGTLVGGIEQYKEQGAKDFVILATHGLLNDPAADRLNPLLESGIIKDIFVTDSLMHLCRKEQIPKLTEVSVAGLIGRAIYKIHNDESVSSLYSVQPYRP